jgi:hypothetical protein
MRMILLSAVLAFGVGLTGTSGAFAASAAAGAAINNAANSSSLLTQVLVCRNVRVCRIVNGRQVCVFEKVCR